MQVVQPTSETVDDEGKLLRSGGEAFTRQIWPAPFTPLIWPPPESLGWEEARKLPDQIELQVKRKAQG